MTAAGWCVQSRGRLAHPPRGERHLLPDLRGVRDHDEGEHPVRRCLAKITRWPSQRCGARAWANGGQRRTASRSAPPAAAARPRGDTDDWPPGCAVCSSTACASAAASGSGGSRTSRECRWSERGVRLTQRSKLAHTSLWECSYKRLKLAQLLGKLASFSLGPPSRSPAPPAGRRAPRSAPPSPPRPSPPRVRPHCRFRNTGTEIC
jgi:hypothetical protein